MPLRLPRATLAAVVAATLACSEAAPLAPTSCRDDTECPADTRCHQSTCTADVPPRASITGPRSASAHTELVFDGSASSDPDDDIVGYTWSVRLLSGGCAPELGPGSQGVFHPVFACPGEFEVILVVRDRTGVASEPAIAPLTIQ